MPRKIPATLRLSVAELRKEGRSLNFIAHTLDLAKSTVQYVVEGIRLTTSELRLVQQMQRAARAENTQALHKARKKAQQHWQQEGHKAVAAARARETSLLYRAEELTVRARLQQRYGADLCKEGFDGFVLKACSTTHVIEWAQTKGAAYKIPARMACVKSLCDKRTRVAFIPRHYLQSKTAERLRKLRVEVYAVEDILE